MFDFKGLVSFSVQDSEACSIHESGPGSISTLLHLREVGVKRRTVRDTEQERSFWNIGHRGAAGHAPENTLRSFREALTFNVDAVELDVHAADGELFVHHDETVDRMTDGSGELSELSTLQIKSLRIEGTETIPTLKEVLQEIPVGVVVNIELKGAETAKPVSELLEQLSEEDQKRILVSSFSYDELRVFNRLSPEISIGVLGREYPQEAIYFAREIGAFSVHIALESVNAKQVETVHGEGRSFFVFTVNDPDDIEEMYELGVDGVFSDYPDRVRDFIQSIST